MKSFYSLNNFYIKNKTYLKSKIIKIYIKILKMRNRKLTNNIYFHRMLKNKLKSKIKYQRTQFNNNHKIYAKKTIFAINWLLQLKI